MPVEHIGHTEIHYTNQNCKSGSLTLIPQKMATEKEN